MGKCEGLRDGESNFPLRVSNTSRWNLSLVFTPSSIQSPNLAVATPKSQTVLETVNFLGGVLEHWKLPSSLVLYDEPCC